MRRSSSRTRTCLCWFDESMYWRDRSFSSHCLFRSEDWRRREREESTCCSLSPCDVGCLPQLFLPTVAPAPSQACIPSPFFPCVLCMTPSCFSVGTSFLWRRKFSPGCLSDPPLTAFSFPGHPLLALPLIRFAILFSSFFLPLSQESESRGTEVTVQERRCVQSTPPST